MADIQTYFASISFFCRHPVARSATCGYLAFSQSTQTTTENDMQATQPTQWEILSKTSNGELVVICTTEATSAEDAKAKTAKFCWTYDITVADVRKAS